MSRQPLGAEIRTQDLARTEIHRDITEMGPFSSSACLLQYTSPILQTPRNVYKVKTGTLWDIYLLLSYVSHKISECVRGTCGLLLGLYSVKEEVPLAPLLLCSGVPGKWDLNGTLRAR